MKKNYNYPSDDSVIRLEKSSSNKVGIIILVLIILALIVFSVFHFYKNGVRFELKLPWQTEERKNSSNTDDKGKEDPESSKTKYDKPSFSSYEFEQDSYELKFSDFQESNLGYDMDITFSTKSEPYTIILEKLLVDGFDTTTTFTRSLNPQESATQTIRINQSELDALDIESFSQLVFYFKSIDSEGNEEVKRYPVSSTGINYPNNDRIGLIEIDNKNQTKLSYYKTEEDKDNTYIYFDFNNYGNVRTQIVSVKKLMINGNIYDYNDLKEEVYHGAEKIISLTIPKSEIKKVENFSVSFTMLNEENGKKTAVYITNEYSKNI